MPSLVTAATAAGLPRTPYLTPAEFLADPGDIDVSDLMPQGTTTQQTDILTQKIWEASSWMDGYVHYVLGATLDTETMRGRIRSDGYLVVNTRAVPILDIESFSVGSFPSTMAAISSSAITDTWIEDNSIRILAVVPQTVAAFGPGSRVFAQWTYVNGWPNTILAANASAGATSITVTSSLGIYAGQQLTVYDPGRPEVFQVASTYIGGSGASTTIPLASALVYAHSSSITLGPQGITSPVSVSGLPSVVKMAAKLATRALIKTRGGGSIELMSIGDESPGKMVGGEAGGVEDMAVAETMLQRYVMPLW